MAEVLLDLESMAVNVEARVTYHDIGHQAVQRWERLFNYSHAQSRREIENWRAKIDRLRVPDDLWEITRDEKGSEGYDREAYEYSMWLTVSGKARPAALEKHSLSANTSYILKLEEPLNSAEKIQAIAQLANPPKTTVGTSESQESDDATFCIIDGLTHQKITDWIAESHPTFRPTTVRLSQSPKALDPNSIAPTLGLDATLPHHRPNSQNPTPTPTQSQYPVWYFFYGNLAQPDELQRRLDLPHPPSYVPALVRGARIRSWRGKYRALVDADAHDVVHGSAFLVVSEEHEDVLRFYETEKYEVVRCALEMAGRGRVMGLVFRFAGTEDELE